MKNTRWMILVLFAAATVLLSSSHLQAAGKGKGRSRGKHAGSYALTVSGFYKGTGTASVTDKVSLQASVKIAGGTTGDLTAKDLPVNKGYFKGSGTVMGVACTIEGRVDLPDAQDDEQNDKQAITARITGTFKDANGKSGRIVAVQQDPTPSNPGNSGDPGNPGNSGNNSKPN